MHGIPCFTTHMPRTDAALRMADRLADGTLAELLARYRKAQVGWAAIARMLEVDHGIVVSSDTLPVWAAKLGVEGDAA